MYKKYSSNEEYAQNIISKFPHMYRKDEESNNYFLLFLYLSEIREISKTLYDLISSLDILKAKGYTLDKFGDTLSLKRDKKETDDNYRIRILSELVSQSKNSTFETIIGVLKLIIKDIEKNVFVFEEGIRKANHDIRIDDNFNIYTGSYKGANQRVYFENKGGTIYIALNKKIPKHLRESIKNTLLEIRAKGVELTIDFKYRVQQGSYICNRAYVGTTRMLNVEDSFFDEISQEKYLETGLSKINIITKEGVR